MIDDILESLEPYTWSEQEKFTLVRNHYSWGSYNYNVCFVCFDHDNATDYFRCYAHKGHKGKHYWVSGNKIYHE